jgi:hypothetical protein
VTTDFERSLAAWHRADAAACEAEAVSTSAGPKPGAAEAAHRQVEAARLRRDADALLTALVRTLRDSGEGAP